MSADYSKTFVLGMVSAHLDSIKDTKPPGEEDKDVTTIADEVMIFSRVLAGGTKNRHFSHFYYILNNTTGRK